MRRSIPEPRPIPTPCITETLHRHLSRGRLDLAVASLPSLARRGRRLPASALADLLSACLRAGTLPLASTVYLFIRTTGYKACLPSLTTLANHVLSYKFSIGQPGHARKLFHEMPHPNVYSYNIMLHGYSTLGLVGDARRLFDGMRDSDIVSWNTLIVALARSGSCRDAVELYCRLMCSSLHARRTPQTFSGLVAACVGLRDVNLVRQVQGHILVVGLLINVVIASSLLDAYGKCGCLENARKVFVDLRAEDRDAFAWTSLIDAYSKAGDFSSAHKLFGNMVKRNSFSWTALISGYVRHGWFRQALNLFRLMTHEGVQPNLFTFSTILCACGSIALVNHGRQIHARMLRTNFHPNAIVFSSLIDMYSKCGDFLAAQQVFDLTLFIKRDVVLWNTMMSSLEQHGHGRKVIELFKKMIYDGIRADNNTFVIILAACRRLGLVDGVKFFESMLPSYAIVQGEDHFICLIDLLGKAGWFKEAVSLLKNMPSGSISWPWHALVVACQIHRNLVSRNEASEHTSKLHLQNASTFVPCPNLVGDGTRNLVERLKENSSSWIEIDNVMHSV